MQTDVVVVGGGVAGIKAACELCQAGSKCVLVERDSVLGGKLRGWHKLFPSFTSSSDVIEELLNELKQSNVECLLGSEVVYISSTLCRLASGTEIQCRAVILATGYNLFDARIKEEYGYGIYDNVITSVDLERMFHTGTISTLSGAAPEKVAILHCVGSRDEKVCQRHCSKVCCITAVKQAIEIKKMLPNSEVFNFYMDMRMFGPGYEELYLTAQKQYNVHFIRGRISEAAQLPKGRLQIKAEDTLTARPLIMSVDMLVLMVGMKAPKQNALFALATGLELQPSGFISSKDLFLEAVLTSVPGIFVAGTVTAPKTIGESISEATMASRAALKFIEG
ncbi:MAG: CoB--CoM heterodisulfide reductase iron-sulfur subunit A family protein [Alistipes sp.]|nr:CoB--CoM heterodisulfide reductase iron-sulfur subunit A family protein [Candidatus Alistipes equi]